MNSPPFIVDLPTWSSIDSLLLIDFLTWNFSIQF